MYVLNGQPVTEVVFEAYKAERDAHFRALAKRSGITLRVTSLEESSRRCEGCDADISDRPSNHTVCLDCYRAGNRGQKHSRGRHCQKCSAHISDRPDSHTVCLDCYRAGNQSGGSGSARKQARGRHCQKCSAHISDRPDSHTVCLDCCNISERPMNHKVCYSCLRR